MNIQLIGDGIEIDNRIRKLVEEKITDEIEKYLVDFNEDLKKASVRIQKNTRHGYKVNFDMRLPGRSGHIYTEEEGDDLTNVLIAVRHELSRQIKDYKSKLQDYRQ